MGARAAVMAATNETKHLVLISYPLQSGDQVRDQILYDISPSVKVIFVSGDRDSMCNLGKLEKVRSKMKCQTWRILVESADHGMNMKPKKFTDAVGGMTGEVVAKWIKENDNSRKEGKISCDEDGEVKWTGWVEAEKETVDSPKEKHQTTALGTTPSEHMATPKGKATGKNSTIADSDPKRSRSSTGGNQAKSERASKRTRRSMDVVNERDPKQNNVSGRTRAAKRAQPT